ncbi:MAG: imidazole glycerol phosphate synthase subunit HisH [Aureispira sp.]|nr:imidazole glycerol phosphate synthase subunit HisH [Aureispira sp.]
MNITIIDYNAGNTQSVVFALERLGIKPTLSRDKTTIEQADKIIFPGVGEASSTMQFLKELGLDQIIPNLKQPVLGICLGMQLLCKQSEEGNIDCLGIIPQLVKQFPNNGQDKVPHMGWNTLTTKSDHPLFRGINPKDYVYYVHSYYAELGEATIAQTDYILPFSAALQYNNFYATQFHPEKSGDVGSKILKNFIELC